MTRLAYHPPEIQAPYLAGLNACFTNWGGVAMYRWCFERAFDGLLPDLLTLKERGELVAGSAVSYRRARVGNGTPMCVGIMTGSWTLPAARRRGYFTQLIEESRRVAAQRGAALLLAFVTASNPSYRRLVEAGAAKWDSYYLASPPGAPPFESNVRVEPISDCRRATEKILARLTGQTDGARLCYSWDEWRSQFLERPEEIECLSIDGDNLAIVEKNGQADRVQFLSCADDARFATSLHGLYARAAARGRTVMLFTTRSRWHIISTQLGLECQPGYLLALTADENARRASLPGDGWHQVEWDLQSGDRM